MYSNYIHLIDQKGSGVDGGASVAGGWETRDLNVELSDAGNLCVLAANQFTLQAGTYRILASAPGYQSEPHQIRLYNITDIALELTGTTEFNKGNNAITQAVLTGRFTIAVPKTFELQHQVNTSRAGNGHGAGNAWGNNIYAVVELWRESP